MGRVNGEIIPRGSSTRDAEIARLYREGATIDQIRETYALSRNGVHRALVRTGCPRRRRGTKPMVVNVNRRSKYPHESTFPTRRPPQVRVWCAQCERNVIIAEAECCRRPFCKARVA